MASPYLALLQSGGLNRLRDSGMAGGGGFTGLGEVPTSQPFGRRGGFAGRRPGMGGPTFEMPTARPIFGRPVKRPLPPLGGGEEGMTGQGGFIRRLPEMGGGGGTTGGNMLPGPEISTNPGGGQLSTFVPSSQNLQADVPQNMGRLQRRLMSFGRGFTNSGVY